MKRKDPAELLLRLLLAGETIDHQGHTYGMSEKGELLAQMKESRPNSSEIVVFYKISCDISAFYKMAEEIGFDELALRCCAISLRRAERGKERVGASG